MKASESEWRPAVYERFRDERSRPFHDLLAGVERRPIGRAVDLGCGTGALTAELHRVLGAGTTLGVDASEAMLGRAPAGLPAGLTLVRGRLEEHQPAEPYDLVFSNAALHWVDDHEALLARLAGWLAPGGQLAFQVPANHDHPSQTVAAEVASEEPYAAALGGFVRRSPVLAPERYAGLLDALGFARVDVRMHVYLHHLEGPDSVVEWVRGTTLLDYERRMEPDLYARYVERYRARLAGRLDSARPYPFTFKRILMWAGGRKEAGRG